MTRAEVLAEYLGATHEAFPSLFGRCPITDAIYIIAPDPLAPGTAADAWLGVLARWEGFWCLHGFVNDFGAEVFRDGFRGSFSGKENAPTPAIVRAMMAADPAFREKMEGAEG
jgi:hypothetical protein